MLPRLTGETRKKFTEEWDRIKKLESISDRLTATRQMFKNYGITQCLCEPAMFIADTQGWNVYCSYAGGVNETHAQTAIAAIQTILINNPGSLTLAQRENAFSLLNTLNVKTEANNWSILGTTTPDGNTATIPAELAESHRDTPTLRRAADGTTLSGWGDLTATDAPNNPHTTEAPATLTPRLPRDLSRYDLFAYTPVVDADGSYQGIATENRANALTALRAIHSWLQDHSGDTRVEQSAANANAVRILVAIKAKRNRAYTEYHQELSRTGRSGEYNALLALVNTYENASNSYAPMANFDALLSAVREKTPRSPNSTVQSDGLVHQRGEATTVDLLL